MQGIVIGVSSGLTMAGLVWLYNRYIVRPDQIHHLRQLILTSRERFYTAQDIPMTQGTKGVLSKYQVRLGHYDDLRSELDLVFAGRTSQLSFDEKRSITAVYRPLDMYLRTIKRSGEPERLDIRTFISLFSVWEQIPWLKLPPYEGELPKD